MNKLRGTISALEHAEGISLVEIAIKNDRFCALVLETPESAPYLRIGSEISLVFKETEVSIAKDFAGEISMRNRFPAMIASISHGTILTMLQLDFRGIQIGSIITTNSARRMNLAVGDAVIGLVKSNEMTLMEE